MTLQSHRLIDLLKLTTQYLQQKGIEDARLNAERLLGHVLSMDRVQLYLNFEKPLQPLEVARLRQLLKRRASNEPLQYILGEAEFYSIKLKVTPDTLIPRPETELLVETVITICRSKFNDRDQIKVIDIGAGSGNIPIALAKNLANALITSIDINCAALKIARQNAEHHNLSERIEFLEMDIFKNIGDSFPQFDCIVSNPPYISKKEYPDLPPEVRNYEPGTALYAGEDGLKFYHRIASSAQRLLMGIGLVAVEIAATQADAVAKIFSGNQWLHNIEIINDLNGLPRVLIAEKKI
ncbi:MAG TPA: peptide chain release factor N(5)-glutamine methyltransferase [bacterium]|nr:peptide chain release factor N(5)-glutamine methyltransferase [bacterium]